MEKEKIGVPAPGTESVPKGKAAKPPKQKKLRARSKNMVENSDALTEKYAYLYKTKTAEKDRKKRRVTFFILIFLGLLLLLGGGLWGISELIQYNNFRVHIDKEGGQVFSLTTGSSYSDGREVIAVKGPQYMDNVTLEDFYDTIPEIESAGGSASGKNFIAATFYFWNVDPAQAPQRYTENVLIENLSSAGIGGKIEEALRIMVIRDDGERHVDVYASANYDATVEEIAAYKAVNPDYVDGDPVPEEVVPGQGIYENGTRYPDGTSKLWYTIPWNTDGTYTSDVKEIAYNNSVRYTVIIWLEGWDPECNDTDALYGKIKFEFYFSQEK